jgi:hypothetical protein
MKRNQNEAKRRRQTLQVWSLAQAQAALPYVGSVMRSLREHRLQAQAQQSRAVKLARRPGRPGRSTIIALEEAKAAAAKAHDAFETALHELHALDIYCLDPNQGLALIPFVHDKQLAWYVFDLFEADPPRFWRFHTDPLEKRRPLAELEKAQPDDLTRLA